MRNQLCDISKWTFHFNLDWDSKQYSKTDFHIAKGFVGLRQILVELSLEENVGVQF